MDAPVTLLVGLPGQGVHLGVDPLSVLFLCLLAPRMVAAVAGVGRPVVFGAAVAAMALTLLAADGFTLILGYGLAGVASWAAMARGGGRVVTAGVAIGAGLCLFPAVFLGPGGLAFLLLLLAAGAWVWLGAEGTMLAGGMGEVGLYVLVRYAFTVSAAVAQPWWGDLLVLGGAWAVFFGARGAVLESGMDAVLGRATVANAGLVVVALGVALRARALGDPALAALGVQAALLLAVGHALFKPLLLLGARAVVAATGTGSLDWLGGLMRGMPRLGLLMLLGASGWAALPLGPGFAGGFLLFHAVFASAGGGGLVAHIGFAAVVAVLGLGFGLGLVGAVRLVGIGFLGRPRSLRAAAAEEAPRRVLVGMTLLAGLCLVPALLPGLLLRLLQPVVAQLAPGAPALPLHYAPLPLGLLMLAVAGACWAGLRRYGVRGARETRAWNGGFGRPPIWLPFGDPATQVTGSGFAQPVGEVLALELPVFAWAWDWGVVRRLRLGWARRRLAVLFGVFLAVLLVVGIGQAWG